MENTLDSKYRPRNLKDVIGQKVPVQSLTNAFASDNIRNAYLLHGKFGTGKTTIGRILAAMINCEKGPTPNPCGSCDNCEAIFKGKSIDTIEIDAGSNRGIDDIRDLKKEIQQHAIYSNKKVVIIDECHSLTGIAAESALKMLEEPPKGVIFILCTTDLNKVLPTIRSRCANYKFNEISWIDIFEHLKFIAKSEGLDFEEEALKICAKSSDGSVRNSLQNLQAVIDYVGDMKMTKEYAKEALGETDENYYFKLIDAIVKTKAPEAFNIVNAILRDGKDINCILSGFYRHFDNLFKFSKCLDMSDEELCQMGFNIEDIKKYKYQVSTFKDNPEEKIDLLFTLCKRINEGISLNVDSNVLFDAYIVKSITLLNKK